MWGAIEADFHREYGVDLSAPGLLRSHSWRWFVTRLAGLSPEAMTRHAVRNRKRSDPAAVMGALAAASRQ